MPGSSGARPSGSRRQAAYRAALPRAAMARSGRSKTGALRRPTVAASAAPSTTTEIGRSGVGVDDRGQRREHRGHVVGPGGRDDDDGRVDLAARGDELQTAAKASTVAPAPRSYGLPAPAPSRSFRSGLRSGTRSPAGSAASAASTLTPPALPMMAIRSPPGSGWSVIIRAASSSSPRWSARTMPAWAHRVSTARSGDAAAAVCEAPARFPATERPLTTASTGLRRARARAMRAKRRGLPNDSR